ncbi:hypothetical protein QE152_g1934 [Popillia japonica]|uniref:Uncharacterized protein n=1 Tax=Popillia japonica TaxID=7064 RepID=A0AAW1N4M7_POPJA
MTQIDILYEPGALAFYSDGNPICLVVIMIKFLKYDRAEEAEQWKNEGDAEMSKEFVCILKPCQDTIDFIRGWTIEDLKTK